MLEHCPSCTATGTSPFFELRDLPVHGNAVLPDRDSALAIARGDQLLSFCTACGVVFNRAFELDRLDYSGGHEESQHHSPRFAAYAEEIAATWVSRYGLAGRRIVEIGCGAGDFLVEMIRAGVGQAVGVDPHFHADRIPAELVDRIGAVPAYFVADMISDPTAAVVCRHTLEHIPALLEFGTEIVNGMRNAGTSLLLAEVPDLMRVLAEGAFWDLQYEHCSYFTPATLDGYLRRIGFGPVRAYLTYADQYVVGEAQLDGAAAGQALGQAELDRTWAACERFGATVATQIEHWRQWMADRAAVGDAVLVWGGGAKGLTFLNVISAAGHACPVTGVVDINPGLQGGYMGGLGLPILAPDHLPAVRPAHVVLMNPTYTAEVRDMLDARGLRSTDLLAL